MSFTSSRRILFLNSTCLVTVVVAVFLIFLLQIWACSDCQAEAIRILGDDTNSKMEKLKERRNINIVTADDTAGKSRSKHDLFHKLYGKVVSSFNTSTKGFEDNKRKVPSCPDPLHN